jgi:membrane fusion protein (multidrug efflux system)
MKSRFLTCILLLATLTGVFFAFSATADEMPEPRSIAEPVLVSAELAQSRTWKLQVPTLGELTAVEGVDVAAKCDGRVRSLHFDTGQSVEQGHLLVQLDDSAERARLASLRARLSQARAELARALPLPAEGDRRLHEVESLMAELAEQQQLADDKRVLAPFSGQLGIRQVDVGEYLRPGDPVVSRRTVAPIQVEFTLPEQRFTSVQLGAELEVRVGALPRRVFAGTVSAIEPWIDPATRTFRLQGLLTNGDGALRPGMLASVSVLLLDEREVLTIPAAAVRRSSHGNTVFLVEEMLGAGDAGDSKSMLTVTRRFLRLGERRGENVAVLGGLEPGARVVVVSARELVDGSQVFLSGTGMP